MPDSAPKGYEDSLDLEMTPFDTHASEITRLNFSGGTKDVWYMVLPGTRVSENG
jgi:hypothetical protein